MIYGTTDATAAMLAPVCIELKDSSVTDGM